MLSARELINRMVEGDITSESLVKQQLDHIDKTDAEIKAWAYVDREGAIAQARSMDQRRAQGKALGSLHGIPIGLKDIIDTRNMPTEYGTPIYKDHQPEANAAIVDHLLEQGAVVLGKTVTTELAWLNESHTRNPHNLKHTPGGSSSGSAAAVAAGQVPLAIGTQTGGSVIRPASFNGVFGYKPSRGLISRRGVLQTSATLDHVGVFARNTGDMALLTDAIKGYDASDSKSYLAPRPELLKAYESEISVEPQIVWIDMPYKDRYSASLNEAAEHIITTLQDSAASIERIEAPQSLAGLIECHKTIYDYEILRSLSTEWSEHRSRLSETAQQGLKRAESRTESEYAEALDVMKTANAWFDGFFQDYDAIATPSSVGVAPTLGNGTGDPVACVIWTLCGLPCVSLPLISGDHGLPMGLQLVGNFDRDDQLLRTARWLVKELAD